MENWHPRYESADDGLQVVGWLFWLLVIAWYAAPFVAIGVLLVTAGWFASG